MDEPKPPELKALMEEWAKNQIPREQMPIYRFICHPCKIEQKVLLKKEDADKFGGACKVCGSPLIQVIGLPTTQSVETADDYRNTKVASDIDRKLDERAQEHFRKHDLPRLVAEKGAEWCKQQGFLDADGKPK